MKKITVTRRRKMASAMMPYWIITGISKEEFKHRLDISKEISDHNEWGQPVGQIGENLDDGIAILDSIGTRISNGETVEIEVDDNIDTIFASTCDGSLSNEVSIKTVNDISLTLTTKGGWTTVSYPYFE